MLRSVWSRPDSRPTAAAKDWSSSANSGIRRAAGRSQHRRTPDAGRALQALGDDRELIATLTAFLRYNGQVEAAAADLDVHRHTLRNRLRRIMALLGDDLESADMRTQLWLAVKADRLLGERRR